MTWTEFKAQTMPVAVQFGAEWDQPTWKMFYRAVSDVPLGLYIQALTDATRTRTKMPSAAQLRELAEQHRRALLAANPYDGCPDCEDQRGYRTILNAAGQKTVERCPCKARHAEKLTGLGLDAPVAQIAAETSGESEQVYPTLNQLPAPIRAQVAGIAGQKVLR